MHIVGIKRVIYTYIIIYHNILDGTSIANLVFVLSLILEYTENEHVVVYACNNMWLVPKGACFHVMNVSLL